MRGAINHIDLTVKDVERSAPFYDAILTFMGYERVADPLAGAEWNLIRAGGLCSIGIKNARNDRDHDRYAAGLHHLAFNADTPADVDRFHAHLEEIGARTLDPPARYPEYAPDYYAVFFADPDGLKLEYVYWPLAPAHAAH